MEGNSEYIVSSRVKPTRGGSPTWELGKRLTTPRRKIELCYVILHRAGLVACMKGMRNEYDILV